MILSVLSKVILNGDWRALESLITRVEGKPKSAHEMSIEQEKEQSKKKIDWSKLPEDLRNKVFNLIEES
jgi:hypothetical protein